MRKLLLVLLIVAGPVFAQQQVQPVAGVLTLNLVPGTTAFKVILSANVTSVVIVNPTPGTIISVIFTENATGGFTVAFGGNIANPCTVTVTANATTTCQFQYDATSNTWNGIGSSGGGGLPAVSISSYGATPASTTNDGAMATSSGTFLATGSSTTPATPSGTTTFNNETVFIAYGYFAAFTAPVSPTQRANITGSAGNFDGLYIGDISVPSAGAYSSFTGSQVSNSWSALAIPMIPTAGQTISVTGAATTGTASSVTSLTINKPTGVTAGTTLIACISTFGHNIMGGGWSRIASGGTATLDCFSRIAIVSEPSSYTFSTLNAVTIGITAAIVGYNNVAAMDNAVTSATMGFTSASVGKILCISAPNFGVLTCGPIGLFSSATTVYPLFANTTASALSGQMLVQGVDSTVGFTGGTTALASGGTLAIPPGTYFLTAGNMTIPYNQAIVISGAGATTPVYFNAGLAVYYVPLNPRGSTIIGIGDLANDPLFYWINSPVANQYALGQNSLEKVALLSDGSGGHGLLVNASHITIRQNFINGFAQDGVLFTGAHNGSGQGFAGNAVMEGNTVSGSHFGIQITGFTAQMEIRNNEVDNHANALEIDGGISSTIFQGNVFQWSGICPVNITAASTGAIFLGNWLEAGGFCFTAPAGSQGPTIIGSHINNNTELNLTNNITGTVFLGNSGGNVPNWISGAGALQNATVDSTNMVSGSNTSPFKISFSGTAGMASCAYADHGGQVTIACFMNGYANTGAAQTWTFPLALATTPLNSTAQTSCGSFNPSSTSTVLTMPANAAMTAETCQFTLQGQTN